MSENLNPLSVINKNLPSQDADKAAAMFDSTVSMNWIPSLTVCYATSDSFKKKIAMPGDFVLAGQTKLGSTIQVVPIDFRLHAIVWDKDNNKFDSECFHLSNDPRDVKEDTEYQTFINQTAPKGCEIQVGSDVFMFLPEQNAFCSFFCKKSLAQAGGAIWKAGMGGRMLEITTHEEESRKGTYYSILIVQTDRAIVGSEVAVNTKDIALPADKFTQNYNLFIKPAKGVEVVEGKGTERVR